MLVIVSLTPDDQLVPAADELGWRRPAGRSLPSAAALMSLSGLGQQVVHHRRRMLLRLFLISLKSPL